MPRAEQEMTDLTAYLQSLGPNGTRALDPTLEHGAKRSVGQELYARTGETRWATVQDWTWEKGPLKGQTEKVAKWKGATTTMILIRLQSTGQSSVPKNETPN